MFKREFPHEKRSCSCENFLDFHYIMQNIFLELSIHFSLVNIERNISLQKKDTWTTATFHEHCNYFSVGGVHLILPIIIWILLQIFRKMYWYNKKINSRPSNMRKYSEFHNSDDLFPTLLDIAKLLHLLLTTTRSLYIPFENFQIC